MRIMGYNMFMFKDFALANFLIIPYSGNNNWMYTFFLGPESNIFIFNLKKTSNNKDVSTRLLTQGFIMQLKRSFAVSTSFVEIHFDHWLTNIGFISICLELSHMYFAY